MIDYDLRRPQYSPWSQMAILLSLCGVGLLVGGLAAIAICSSYLHVSMQDLEAVLTKPENANIAIAFQFISASLFMAVPSFIFARIINKDAFKYIGFNSAISGKQVFIVVGILLISFFLSGALSRLNEIIPLPKNLEQYFKLKEDEYNNAVLGMAQMKTTTQYLITLIVIAVMPAIFEEMLFRGALQPIIISLSKRAFTGIFITSVLFSALHGSYYGFLPRLALGLIIGYIYYFSKNLWLAVTMHFLYNAYGVTEMYVLTKYGLLNSKPVEDDSFPIYFGLLAAAALYVIFIFFKRESEVVISMHNIKKM